MGNSRGIRIPKRLIEQCGFGDTVELRVEQDRLVITSDGRPRQEWEKAFRAAGAPQKDYLSLKPLPSNTFDRGEWRW